jgi:hypothetical protein
VTRDYCRCYKTDALVQITDDSDGCFKIEDLSFPFKVYEWMT